MMEARVFRLRSEGALAHGISFDTSRDSDFDLFFDRFFV
jgi:hypothetical protein